MSTYGATRHHFCCGTRDNLGFRPTCQASNVATRQIRVTQGHSIKPWYDPLPGWRGQGATPRTRSWEARQASRCARHGEGPVVQSFSHVADCPTDGHVCPLPLTIPRAAGAAARVASGVPAPRRFGRRSLVIVRAVGCPVVCRAAGVMDGHPWLRGEKKILGCPWRRGNTIHPHQASSGVPGLCAGSRIH